MSYLCFLTIFITAIISGCKASKSRVNNYWKNVTPFIIAFTFILGFRWNVGVDTNQYHNIYQWIQRGSIYRDNLEIGYKWLNIVLSKTGLGSYLIFIFCSFMLIYSFLFYVRKGHRFLWLSTIFWLPNIYLACNLTRQYLAISCLYLAYDFLIQRKWLPYALLGVVATSIHSSAIIGFLLLLAISYIPYPNPRYSIPVYLVTVVLGITVLNYIGSYFSALSFLGNYGIKANYWEGIQHIVSTDFEKIGVYGSTSLINQIFTHTANLLYIYWGYKLMRYNKNLKILYTVTFTGMCLNNLFNSHELFMRMVKYIILFSPLFYGYISFAIIRYSNDNFKKICVVLVILSYIYTYIRGIEAMDLTMKHSFMFYWNK